MESKISTGEAYFLVVFALMADLINWMPFMNWFTTIVTLPVFQFYFWTKGVSGGWSLVGNLGELIPLVSALPLVTGGVVVTIARDWMRVGKLKETTSLVKGAKRLAENIPTQQ